MQFSDNIYVGGGGVIRHGTSDAVIKCMDHGGVAIYIFISICGGGWVREVQQYLNLALYLRYVS